MANTSGMTAPGITGCGARRWVAAAVMAVGLAGGLSACGTAYDADSFWKSAGYWQEGSATSGAMANLAKGDLTRAEALGNDAMRRNPKDPYALLVLATVYQNTGRADLAREYYESLVSLHPQATAMTGTGAGAQRKTIEQIATEALAALPPPAQAADPRIMGLPPVLAPAVATSDLDLSPENNVIVRFQALRQLLDGNLITRDEYNERRGANLAALLRYSVKQPAAAGLEKDAPPPDQVARRLKALSAAVEEGKLSATEQMTERQAILDALLPAQPQRRADRAEPVTSDMQLAAVIGWVGRLRQANVVTDAEQARETGAARQQFLAYQTQAEMSARAAAGMAMPMASTTGQGVQLAAFHSEDQAHKAWAALQKQFPAQLGGLQPVVSPVTVRRRGTLYRLSAGPLADRKTAIAVCRAIRKGGGVCQPTVLK